MSTQAPTTRANNDDATESGAGSSARLVGERLIARVVRRPKAWIASEWTPERTIRYVVTALSLAITTGIVMNVVHLSPLPGRDLVFADNTPTGGDFGAHVWGPAYLRDHILPSFRLNGWSMDWYAGLPTYRFYMVLPALAVLLVDVVLPYGVALKFVGVLGVVTMPLTFWAFGRFAGFRYPMPELFAFAGLVFLLDESFTIYGGNVLSTMAGEFSFSIALSLAMLAFGLFTAGLRTGKYRVWASVLIAAACVSHGIVLIFVILGLLVFSAVWVDRQRWVYILTVGVTSFLLLIWWVGPFLFGHEFMTDMKYGAKTDWVEMYFPQILPLDILITSLAVFGFMAAIIRRHLNGIALGILALLLAAGVYFAQHSLPLIGLLWNPRVLPFLYVVRYLLMMIGIVELFGLLGNLIGNRRARQVPSVVSSSAYVAVTGVVVLSVLGFMYQKLPFDEPARVTADGSTRYGWGPFTGTETKERAKADGWAAYNFRGYEGRDQYYTEYHGVVTTMSQLGDDPEFGCGRALWENSPDNGQYGTTMALMLLPFWTDGCIGSMEALFFEASGTTPYSFLATGAMSKQSSNPVRGLRYVNNDAEIGVRHLQDLGVRYAMVRTPEAQEEAARHPDLTFAATSGPWVIYRVDDAPIVEALDVQPVVIDDRQGDGRGASDSRELHLETGTSWFQQPDEWAAMPADGGPSEWQRVDVEPDLSRRVAEGDPGGPQVDIVIPTEQIEQVELPEVTVSNLDIGDQSLSFDVDQVGVPMLVKVSYFPNWSASGAEGPWRIGPNMMVVVPTDTTVEMSYRRSPIDGFTMVLSLIGVGLCVLWRRKGDVEYTSEYPVGRDPDPDELAAELRLGRPTAVADPGIAAEVLDVGSDDASPPGNDPPTQSTNRPANGPSGKGFSDGKDPSVS